jgi:hypothetical protein
MALGLEFGFVEARDQEAKDLTLRRTKEFLARFRGEFGTTKCKDLLGCDLNTEEGRAYHKERNQRELVCMKCVTRAAAIVEEMKAVR